MRNVVLSLTGALILGGTAVLPAQAAEDAVRIREVIPYRSEAVGTAAIREQCSWNRELSQNIVKASKGKVVATDQELSSLGGKTLDIVITYVHAAGGGSVSGPKWGRISGELKENGQLIGNFDLQRVTMRPFTFKACSTLSLVADALADDVVSWLKNPVVDPNASKAIPTGEAPESAGAGAPGK
jgi:hypothetical protein